MALKDLFKKSTEAKQEEQEPVVPYEQILSQLEATGISDISGITVEPKSHKPESVNDDTLGSIILEVIEDMQKEIESTSNEEPFELDEEKEVKPEDGVEQDIAEDGIEQNTSEDEKSDEDKQSIVVPDEEPTSEEEEKLVSVEEEKPVSAEDSESDLDDSENDEAFEDEPDDISDTDIDSSVISDENKTEEVTDVANVNEMLDNELSDYEGVDKSVKSDIKENVIIPDEVAVEEKQEEPIEEEKLVVPDEGDNTNFVDEEEVTEAEEKPKTKGNNEPVPEFYTDNTKLILLLRKMGILDALERISEEDIPTEELLKATSSVQKLASDYKEAEALAATYLESMGITFKKVAGDDYSKYSAVQILFIGEKILNDFSKIEAILNPEFSVAQMSCICELVEDGVETDWCSPSMAPSVMKSLADLWKLHYNMEQIKTLKTVNWHGVMLIMAAERVGITDITKFIKEDNTLDENGLYTEINRVTGESDAKEAKLNSNGIEYSF